MKKQRIAVWYGVILVLIASLALFGCGGGGGGDTTPLSAAKAITAFSFTSPAAIGIIDVNAKTIAVSVPHGTSVTALIATFTMTGASVKVGATAQVSGTTANDFTSPVTYTVTAADSTTATYIVTVTVAAIAVPKTGQTICTDSTGTVIACANTGQDGALLKGVAWPNPRFTANTDTSVTDNLTGLAWVPNGNLMPTRNSGWDQDGTVNDGGVTWQHALDYVAKLNTESYLGHNDWRLPNSNELMSLVNYGQSNPGTWLNNQGFINVQDSTTQNDRYWSSTTAGTSYAWFVDMRGVMVSMPKGSFYYVWPVRDGQGSGASAVLPKTGQTICYNTAGTVIACATTGQDGDLLKGVAWPSPRFASIGDTTITDNLTGLAWAPNGNVMPTKDSGWDTDGSTTDGKVTWQHAFDYVAKLNADNYLGHNDWRLPNVNEMASLVNAGQYTGLYNPATWLNTQGFTNAQAGIYWTSTTWSLTSAFGTDKDAWYIDMSLGGITHIVKSTSQEYVWPVRAGQ